MTENARLLEAVAELARAVGLHALRNFRHGMDVEWKSDGSPVTTADRGAEETAREWLAARFPEDGVLGEEYGSSNAGAQRQWIIDPIDGTRSFVRGVPLWGSLIAVARGEEILAGAIYCPAVDELVCAALGEGCWWNGSRARVSGVNTLQRALVCTTDPTYAGAAERGARFNALAAGAGTVRAWGDCYGYLLVATGRAEVMADPQMSLWDAAALQPVIDEAGGVFTDWTGRRTAFGNNAIATNAELATPVREILLGGAR